MVRSLERNAHRLVLKLGFRPFIHRQGGVAGGRGAPVHQVACPICRAGVPITRRGEPVPRARTCASIY